MVDVGEELEFSIAGAGEVAEISALVRAAYQPYVQRIGREPAPMNADHGDAVADGRVLLARSDNRLVGVLITDPRSDHLLIENVAVRADGRGLGVGSRLLRRAEDEARRLGLPELRLYTNAKMTENLAYYPRRGFAETHRAVEDGFERVFFTKRID